MTQFLSVIAACLICSIIVCGIIIPITHLVTYIKERTNKRKYSKYHITYEPNHIKISRKMYSGDCAIRAVSKLFHTTWDIAFDRVTKYAKENGCITSTTWMLLNYLRKHGYSYEAVDNKWYRKDLTFGEFVKTHPKGKYAIFSDDHVAAVIDGKIYDAYDSTSAKVAHIMTYVAGDNPRNSWRILRNSPETDND